MIDHGLRVKLTEYWKYAKMLFVLLAKDLKLEIRSKEIVPSMFVFGLTVILVFALSFSNSSSLMPDHLSGLLWLVILFTSTFGLNRSFYLEKNHDLLTDQKIQFWNQIYQEKNL